MSIQSLMSPAPNQTLLTIAATGDRVIQSMFESQVSIKLKLYFFVVLDLVRSVEGFVSLVKYLQARPAP
jgi:hypothetical protein